MKKKHLILAITGASGAIYGLRLGGGLLARGIKVTFLVSRAGFLVLQEECGLNWRGDAVRVTEELRKFYRSSGLPEAAVAEARFYEEDDFSAPVASGSSTGEGMIIAPCSMGTLSRIAWGNSGNLIERAADVMLKERRTLVLVPRETPLSEIHLENMLRLARAGARLIPPMPAFYQKPKSVDDMVDFVVGKVLDSLNMEHDLYRPWGERE